ncbi:BamA/TamA family outer membrane protein [Neptunitalea lumnitzerae]|uniref:Outer membrane protein/protective antigen OMA87 n=1 Tax=Neptunitalea lumnitzerae TaxID=2965509 RepID=A0ABQ5MIU2_9FLAO|nr:hypothetical protein [Neptunitalea sp. Y10]GLB49314.1 hypothetical protein Y10_16820 [Neptunitalea sp. Y10]
MKYVVLIIIFFCGASLYAQKKDSISTKRKEIDSVRQLKNQQFYQNLQDKSGKSKFGHMLHDFIFKPVNPSDKKATAATLERDLQRNFKEYQGKTIRKIVIKSLDPIGYNEKDTTQVPTRKLDILANSVHLKTTPFTVRGLLLVKENQPLDSLLILESERLLRRRNFIRRALIKPTPIQNNDEEVDLYIYVLDSWSFLVDGDVSGSSGEIRLREFNFMGLGHRLTMAYKQGYKDNKGNAYTLGYRAANLYNTFINAEASRDLEIDNTFENKFVVDRTFYSPFTRWAGKIGYTEQLKLEGLYINQLDTIIYEPVEDNTFDVWSGLAIPISNQKNSEKLPTNLILAARYTHTDYMDKPDATIDSVSYFQDEDLYMTSIGVRHVNYVRDRYIFRNGDIEDIAIGSSLFLNAGYQQYPMGGNCYLGTSITLNNYFKNFGYLAGNFEYGSYFNDGKTTQSLLRLESTYFTPVFRIGAWYFRQFARINSVMGFGRKDFVLDRITLNEDNGIQGFDSPIVHGTRKFVFSFKTQSYVPFNWLGFRMSPFINVDLGYIGQEKQPLFQNESYKKFGFGFLISNDYFVFENITISFFYIPEIPGANGGNFQIKASTNNNFGLENYDYQPPHVIPYK